ncbi:hypothetical protein NARC_10097 [Candidatus Nitrosocosmicus arcticus]|uniref:Uncharacterized protein n=1 Tax=Candidatus Nitrosocosmicus arcticus TaxID=2035267 RepID=A0A557SYL3_9ARCH|nr:hypothetical protein NARC_10097 [Candidatus Nitrosocosmicus arcticus]
MGLDMSRSFTYTSLRSFKGNDYLLNPVTYEVLEIINKRLNFMDF